MSTRTDKDRVRAFLEGSGISRTKLSKMAGLGINGLRNVDHSDWNPKADSLISLIDAIERIAQEASE